MTNPYRSLPSIDAVIADKRVSEIAKLHGHDAVVNLAREILETQRIKISRGGETSEDTVTLLLARSKSLESRLVGVVNATGVIIHTNLGRAPLSRSAIEAMRRITTSYSTLEFDLSDGTRSSRDQHLESLLCSLTGAEAALVVNNGASALLLALAALCAGGEVPISRGQLVEIGGGFRIPDVMRESGAVIVEVGTTNRTYASDYEMAMNDDTKGVLRVHSSNFTTIGFTASTSIADLAEIAERRNLVLIDDLGSGALIDTQEYGLASEPLVQDSVSAGAHVVLFSGDKLIGGPQAGIIVGRKHEIDLMKRHPLARAVRIDKASIAGLIETLKHYSTGNAIQEIPVWRMIAEPVDQLAMRARRWARVCPQHCETLEEHSTIGGGSLPGEEIPTVVCAIRPPTGDVDELVMTLRKRPIPIIARIKDERVLLDPRTVDPREDGHVEQALSTICSAHRPTSISGSTSPER